MIFIYLYLFIGILFLFIVIQISIFILSKKSSNSLSITLSHLSLRRKYDNRPPSLPITQIVPDFSLKSALHQNTVSLDTIVNTKPGIFLIANSGCDACSLDLVEFAEESLILGSHYNFVLLLNSEISKEEINLSAHKFHDVLLYDRQFLETYKISYFPTFMMINSKKQLVSLPVMTSQFKMYYRPEHLNLIEQYA